MPFEQAELPHATPKTKASSLWLNGTFATLGDLGSGSGSNHPAKISA